MDANTGSLGILDVEEQVGGNSKDKLSHEFIVLCHLMRLSRLACVEWHGGFWVQRAKAVGAVMVSENFYEEDSREKFANGIDALADMTAAFFDKQMFKEEKSLNEQLDVLEKNCMAGVDRSDSKAYEDAVQHFRELKIVNRRQLFRALCCFLKRAHFLEGSTGELEAEAEDAHTND